MVVTGACAASEHGPSILIIWWLVSMGAAYACGSSDTFKEISKEAEERDLAFVDWETPSGAPRIVWKIDPPKKRIHERRRN